jgi:hypothetical protein
LENGNGHSRISGWKEIAVFLECSVRTAQRWERLEGLPIHHQFHAARSTPYIVPVEVNFWRSARELTRSDPNGRPDPLVLRQAAMLAEHVEILRAAPMEALHLWCRMARNQSFEMYLRHQAQQQRSQRVLAHSQELVSRLLTLSYERRKADRRRVA